MGQTRAIALLAVLAAVLLAGCGGGEDPTQSTASSFSDKDTEAASSKADQIKGNVPYTTSDKFKEKFNNDSGTETRTACSLLSKNRIADLVARQEGGKPPELDVHGTRSVSYTHLTLPTILRV